MKAILLFLAFSATLTAYGQPHTAEEKLLIERLKWFYRVKEFAAEKAWKEFSGANQNSALVYFTDSASYIIDPGGVLQYRVRCLPFYDRKGMTIYKTVERIDSKPFHMETAVDLEDSSLIYFKYPVLMCSDLEGMKNSVPDKHTLQEWACMAVHEYFHGFQLKHQETLLYGNKSISLRGSELQSFYTTYDWFKTSIIKENQLLLTCLVTDNKSKLDSMLNLFVNLREKRRKRVESMFHNSIAKHEDFYEKIEGTAKYVDLYLLNSFKDFPVDSILLATDQSYQPTSYSKFELSQEEWLYDTNSMNYFYGTGFNLLRILDKLEITYKPHFFQNRLSPYSLVADYVARLKKAQKS